MKSTLISTYLFISNLSSRGQAGIMFFGFTDVIRDILGGAQVKLEVAGCPPPRHILCQNVRIQDSGLKS